MPDLFNRDLITNSDKEACVRRELSYRRRLYPRWVDAGRIQQEDAAREIEIMEAIAEDYAKCAAVAEGRHR